MISVLQCSSCSSYVLGNTWLSFIVIENDIILHTPKMNSLLPHTWNGKMIPLCGLKIKKNCNDPLSNRLPKL